MACDLASIDSGGLSLSVFKLSGPPESLVADSFWTSVNVRPSLLEVGSCHATPSIPPSMTHGACTNRESRLCSGTR
jgi:hypothetical protein